MANDKNRKAEFIKVPNTLRIKLGGGRSGPLTFDPDAIKRAEKTMDDLKVEFSDWLAADIANLAAACATFIKDRNESTAGGLFRAAHDLKGQATTFEYPLIARVAASLAKLMEGTKALGNLPQPLVDAHVSAIHVIHRDKIKDISNRMALTLVEELEGRVIGTLERASQPV